MSKKKTHTGKTKLIPVAPDDTLTIQAKRSFVDSQSDLPYINHQGLRFQLLNAGKKKDTNILDSLRASELTENFHFWVNCPFKDKGFDQVTLLQTE